MVENRIRDGIYHAIHRCAETNNKNIKKHDKKKNHHIEVLGCK